MNFFTLPSSFTLYLLMASNVRKQDDIRTWNCHIINRIVIPAIRTYIGKVYRSRKWMIFSYCHAKLVLSF